MVGSLSKEFPLADVDRTIGLVRNGMRYDELRQQAKNHTHSDIPAIITNRFLLVQNGTLVRDRFLSLAESEGLASPRIRKIMYFTFAFRDFRFRRFILERVCGNDGLWRLNQVTRKTNASFFEEFFAQSTTSKVRSNIEFFLVESGIVDPASQSINLGLEDGWLPDAVQVAAQHEPNIAKRRAMANDPIGFLISNGWNGLANATVADLKNIETKIDVGTDVSDDEEIGDLYPPNKTGKQWDRKRPNSMKRQQRTIQANIVAQERANQAHHQLEAMLVDRAKRAGFTPMFNENMDVYFDHGTTSVIAEIKSCWELNLHTQFRRSVSQLFEYHFLYESIFSNEVTLMVLLEMAPEGKLAWLLDYANDLGIFVAWRSVDGDALCSSMAIPDGLSEIIQKC